MADPQRARSIFLEAVERHTPDQWSLFLDEACGVDQELRKRVEALLCAHDEANSMLDVAALPPSATIDQPIAEHTETVVGPYKLIEPIGEGGMGTVWMAQQTAPVKRLVAVKLIKAGMDSRQVIARFEAERQALALMDHPNIARVLDAGTTEAGRPYFVMDLVKGVSITKYCDDHHLTPRQRLELFIPVCQAVQHAHQKGIIHRDIKPSNVLVALYDGKPVPKVIDFGVAKAAGQSLTDKTLVTGFGAVVGTLEYMSPEQAETNQLDIDTRSDIYSLGVLLYELLTGSTPFSKKDLEKAGMLEMLRVIREDEPSKPSTKLSSSDALPTLAANRGTEPARLTKLVRGELDWIVMKSLEKDRNRRYETATGFAMDVQRYLVGEAVQAVPPSAAYRLRKFARRNRGQLVVAGVLAAGLLVAVSGVGWAVRDRSARQTAVDQEVNLALKEAEQLQEQARWPEALSAVKRAEGLLAGSGSHELRERVNQLRKDLNMVLRLEEIRAQRGVDLDDEGANQAYAQAFADFGIDVEALSPTEAAERIRSRSAIAVKIAWELDYWALVRRNQKNDPVRFNRLLGIARLADPDPWRSELRLLMGREDLNALRKLADSSDIATLPVHSFLLMGNALVFGGDTPASVAWLRKAHRQHPGDAQIGFDLAFHLGRLPSADAADVLRFAEAALAAQPKCAAMYGMVGSSLARLNRLDEAILNYRRSLDLKADDFLTHAYLGIALGRQGKVAEAIACYRRAIELKPNSAWLHSYLANGLSVKGDYDGAVATYLRALEIDPKYAEAHFSLAMTHWRQGEKAKAHECYDRGGQSMVQNRPADAALRRLRLEAQKLLGVRDHRPFQGHTKPVHGVAILNDGRRALSASQDNTLRMWDLRGGKELHRFEGHNLAVTSVAVSPDGRRALSGSHDRTMRLWDVEARKELRRFEHPEWVACVALSPDGRLGLSGTLNTVHLWDLEGDKELRQFKGHDGPVRTVAFTADGRLALSGGADKTVCLWEVSTGREIRRFTGHTGWVLCVALSPDGKRVTSGGTDRSVRVWEVDTGREVGCLRGHQGNVEGLVFTRDGQRVVSGSADGTIRVWDLSNGRELHCVGTVDVLGIALSSDGREVLSAHTDHTVRLWVLPEAGKEPAKSGKKSEQ